MTFVSDCDFFFSSLTTYNFLNHRQRSNQERESQMGLWQPWKLESGLLFWSIKCRSLDKLQTVCLLSDSFSSAQSQRHICPPPFHFSTSFTELLTRRWGKILRCVSFQLYHPFAPIQTNCPSGRVLSILPSSQMEAVREESQPAPPQKRAEQV